MDNIRTLTVEHTTSTAHRLPHYDGVCNRVHGHNIRWEVEMSVDVPDEDHQMALDFKDVTEVLDEYDHAILLSKDDFAIDKMLEFLPHGRKEHARDILEDLFGKVEWFENDPTCEHVSQVVAERLREIENVRFVNVTMHETDKYGMEASSFAHEQ